MTLTPDDTALLNAAGCLVKRTTAQLYRIRKENTRLAHALVAARADAELYRARAEFYQEDARFLRLSTPRLLRRGKGEETQ